MKRRAWSAWDILSAVIAGLLASVSMLAGVLLLFAGLVTSAMTGKSGPTLWEMLAEFWVGPVTIVLGVVTAVLIASRHTLLALVTGGASAAAMVTFFRSMTP